MNNNTYTKKWKYIAITFSIFSLILIWQLYFSDPGDGAFGGFFGLAGSAIIAVGSWGSYFDELKKMRGVDTVLLKKRAWKRIFIYISFFLLVYLVLLANAI